MSVRRIYARSRMALSQAAVAVRGVLSLALLACACILCLFVRKERDTLVWGVTPLINYKYWSAAMRGGGWKSLTLVTHHYPAHRREDYDLYLDDLVPSWISDPYWRTAAARCFGLLYVVRHAGVVHLDFRGGVLADTPFWRWEAQLLRRAGIRTFAMPYGGDAHLYSRYTPDARNALLMSYPQYGRVESAVKERMDYWLFHADAVLCGFMLDGIPRWDVPVPNMLTLDLEQWQGKSSYSSSNGRNGPVRVVHAPNHRGAKGTEFVLEAVSRLGAEGLHIDLVLLEGVSNDEVKRRMHEADILAEQLVLPGYGLNAIEGMASGLAVLSNLDSEAHTRVFRRYSFLDECPILSTSPESVTDHLRLLVTAPALRAELGKASRQYAEKYYSYEAAQFLFGSIYRKLLKGEEVDLINLYHPLKSPLAGRPKVQHPLVENKLPAAHSAWRQAIARSA